MEAHVLDVTHDEHHAERDGQVVDPSLEQAANFTPRHHARRRFAFLVGHIGLHRVRFGAGQREVLVEGHDDDPIALPPAQTHERLVDHDAGEPGGQLGAVAKFADVAIGVEVGVRSVSSASASFLRIARATRKRGLLYRRINASKAA
jgi:hypothetical protein